VRAGLWDEVEGGIYIHDWDDHNSLRDDKRARDAERKRRARAEGRWNESDRPRPKAAPNAPQGRAPARVDGSEGSERNTSRAVTVSSYAEQRPSEKRNEEVRNEEVRNLIDVSLREAS
jgi:hypothetical protein